MDKYTLFKELKINDHFTFIMWSNYNQGLKEYEFIKIDKLHAKKTRNNFVIYSFVGNDLIKVI